MNTGGHWVVLFFLRKYTKRILTWFVWAILLGKEYLISSIKVFLLGNTLQPNQVTIWFLWGDQCGVWCSFCCFCLVQGVHSILRQKVHKKYLRILIPVGTGRKVNVNKKFRRRPGRSIYVLCLLGQGKITLKLNSNANEKYEYGRLGCWYIKLTLFKKFLN